MKLTINDLNDKLLEACKDIKNQPDYDGYLNGYHDALINVSKDIKANNSTAESSPVELETFTHKDALKLIFLLEKLDNCIEDFQDGYFLPNCFSRVEGQQLVDIVADLFNKFLVKTYIKCEYCDGLGISDHLSCAKSTSECCGGCYVSSECEECKGTGFLILDK